MEHNVISVTPAFVETMYFQYLHILLTAERKAKLPEGADHKTMQPRRMLAKEKCSTVALALPVCLSGWLAMLLAKSSEYNRFIPLKKNAFRFRGNEFQMF